MPAADAAVEATRAEPDAEAGEPGPMSEPSPTSRTRPEREPGEADEPSRGSEPEVEADGPTAEARVRRRADAGSGSDERDVSTTRRRASALRPPPTAHRRASAEGDGDAMTDKLTLARTAVRVGARGLAVLAAAGIAVGAVAAAALVPWPEHRAEAPSVVVQPAETGQLRVCPGPMLSIGEDPAAATTANSVGPPNRDLRGGAGRRCITRRRSPRPTTPAPTRTARRSHRDRARCRRRRDAGRCAVADRHSRDALRLRRSVVQRSRRRVVARRRGDRRRTQRHRAVWRTPPRSPRRSTCA